MNYGNNIGYLGSRPGSISTTGKPVKHTQVYYATHRDNGQRDSYMDRSFISFSFGGKLIEDFNLIAVINGDRMNKQLHANFQDLTSEYEIVNGQYYWGTYYSNNQISFTLATDGITQNELDEFKNWFAPGQTRELILSEHPNRAIMARVSEPPTMDVIPFEEDVTVMINNSEHETSTTKYKGEITLNLTMDEPFWYSKVNLLGRFNGNTWSDLWTDANNNNISIYNNKDALKIISEDRIPTILMLREPIFLGNGKIFRNTSEIGTNITFSANENAYLYYAGTAPEIPIINFKIAPNLIRIINNNNNIYIEFLKEKSQRLELKIPKFLEDWEQMYSLIFNKVFNGTVIINDTDSMRKEGNLKLTHPEIRKIFFKILDYYDLKITGYNDWGVLANNALVPIVNTDIPWEFNLNFQAGEMTGTFYTKKIKNNPPEITSFSDFNSLFSTVTFKEDISDMILSKPIILDERNTPSSNGTIQYRTNAHPEYSYKISHNFASSITLSVLYQNKYY